VYNVQLLCKHVLHMGGPKAYFLAWWMTMQKVVCSFDKCLCQTLWRDQGVSDDCFHPSPLWLQIYDDPC